MRDLVNVAEIELVEAEDGSARLLLTSCDGESSRSWSVTLTKTSELDYSKLTLQLHRELLQKLLD